MHGARSPGCGHFCPRFGALGRPKRRCTLYSYVVVIYIDLVCFNIIIQKGKTSRQSLAVPCTGSGRQPATSAKACLLRTLWTAAAPLKLQEHAVTREDIYYETIEKGKDGKVFISSFDAFSSFSVCEKRGVPTVFLLFRKILHSITLKH